ncbi:MAG: DUF2953 domain-containing protein [Lachnospiraceae bacterium]|nr:DUF2953 domain-containing protein [Lachnospiraceae bacterium]
MILLTVSGIAAGAVILRILKFLGILLLILLGFLLIFLLAILFCPICYEAAGRAEKPDYQVRGKIRLLLGILTLRAQVDEKGFRYSLKLFGLRVKRGGRKWESAEKETEEAGEGSVACKPEKARFDHEGSRKDQSESQKAQTVVKKDRDEVVSAEQGKEKSTGVTPAEKETPESREKSEEEKPLSSHKTGKTEASSPGGPDKAKKKRRSQKKKEPSPDASAKSSPLGKIRGITATIRHVWEELHDPTNRRMFNLVKGQVFRILRHIRPRKLRLRGVVGTGDPAQTGWILGIFYMLYPFYGSAGEFELAGDFDKKVLQGRFYLAGHIVPAVPLSAGIRLLLDRDIRHFVRKTFF